MRGLSRLHIDYLKCRSWGHEWEDFRPLQKRSGWGELLSLRCVRCGTERFDTIDSNGDISKRQYVYPEGYKVIGMKQGVRLTARDLRKEVVRRIRAGRVSKRTGLRLVKGA